MHRLAAMAALILTSCGRYGYDAIRPVDHDAPDDAISTLGCSDDQRDELADVTMHPTIAACAATWTGELDLRAPSTGVACGDDLGPCAVPADACAAGWHVCTASGDLSELLVLTVSECNGLVGRYVAASGHCATADPCVYEPPGASTCRAGEGIDCTQPICCGATCSTNATCKDAVWPTMTNHNVADSSGCANTPSANQDGVLCCRG